MSEPKVPTLYDLPNVVAVLRCRECGARLVFVPSPKTASKNIPLSIDSPLAIKDAVGATLRAPSHFTDCTNPSRFSRKAK